MSVERDARQIAVSVSNQGRPRPLVVQILPPPGAEVDGNTRELRFTGTTGPETKRLVVRPGIEIAPEHEPLRIGAASERLRVIDTGVEGGRYTARLQGLGGRTYRVRLTVPFDVTSIAGGTIVARDRDRLDVDVPFTGSAWSDRDLIISLGRRLPSR